VAKRTAGELDGLLEKLASHGLGELNPSAEQLRRLLEADLGGPLQYLNLLAYHDTARYPEGHEMAARQLSGAEAYALYGQVALRHVTRRGGRLALWNDVALSVIGADDGWHHVAIMEYPNAEAFLDMLGDPDYTAGLVHRDAGLARTLVLVTKPLLRGA
jgi:uncharacterized protein (DUF1330 family)